MQQVIKPALGVLLLSLSLSAQSLVLPHIVDGGAWQSTIVLTNTTGNTAAASLVFHQEPQGSTDGSTIPWNPAFQEPVSASALSLTGGSTLFLHTLGSAPVTTSGWAELNADAGVIGYVVFTNKSSGKESDGTAPAVAPTSRILVPYDDANGNKTGIAIANPTSTAQSIMVAFRNDAGTTPTASFTLPAFGHTSFILSEKYSVVRTKAGLAEFFSATGNISIIGLRINPTNSFTSAPAYFQNGAPLIVNASGSGSGSGDYGGGMPPTDPGVPCYYYCVTVLRGVQ